ncbi:MAG: chorismate mutase [Gammaproteobacteria bacterium]|nr:chorismate mutase [Gammaproteobacteria bacterium]MCP4474922.1 chorismate mutase [Gammaproteobacteria bacterium]
MIDLEQWRQQIEIIDGEIIAKIADRFALCQQIGLVKKSSGKVVKDEGREDYLMNYYEQQCRRHDLNSALIKQIFSLILTESKRLQQGL